MTAADIRFPYGVADFQSIRRAGMFYADRTSHVRDLERLGRTLVFLRPRRFGKSTWLQTLASYYDLRLDDDFRDLFGGLAIGREPTDERNDYFVLQWNFSEVSARGTAEQVARRLNDYVNSRVRDFLLAYEGQLSGEVAIEPDATNTLRHVLAHILRTGHRLYLLIDEYDNFINEIMVQDAGTYRALVDAGGPFKELFKSVKSGTEGQGIERVFLTGVSPVALNDLTSGFNIAEDVSHEPELAGLCGFREPEIRSLLERIAASHSLAATPEQLLATMRTWYDGYRFAPGQRQPVYNPTNALYFLKHLVLRGQPPRDLHDENLRSDRGRLGFLARTGAGSGVIEQAAQGDGTVEVTRLLKSLTLTQLMEHVGRDRDAVASFLYYLGLLTRAGSEPPRLRIPNLVVRKLFLDRLLELYLSEPEQTYEARRVALDFVRGGELPPLLTFFEQRLLPVLSNRDRGAAPTGPGRGGGVNEMTLKALFLAILFDDQRFAVFSELELERGYVDLCLLARPEMRAHGLSDVLFEFKLVRRSELGRPGGELRQMDESRLRELTPVKTALRAAREQCERYRDALRKRLTEVRPRCYAVVAVGLERMLGEEVRPEL